MSFLKVEAAMEDAFVEWVTKGTKDSTSSTIFIYSR